MIIQNLHTLKNKRRKAEWENYFINTTDKGLIYNI